MAARSRRRIAVPSFARPSTLLLLALVAVTAIAPPDFGQYETGVVCGAIMLALLAWVYVLRYSRWGTPLDRPLMALLAWSFVSAAVGFFRGNPPDYLLGDAFQIAEFAAFFFLVTASIVTRRQFKIFLWTAATFAGASGLWEAISWFAGWSVISIRIGSEELPREGGTISAFIFPIVLCLVLSRWSRSGKKYAVALLIPVIVSIVVSFARTFWIGDSIALLVVLISLDWRRRASLVGLMGGGLIAIHLIFVAAGHLNILESMQDRVFYTFDQINGNNMQRTRLIELEDASKEITRSPVTGIGLGGTYVAYSATPRLMEHDYMNSGMDFYDKHFIHNTYLQVALRLGLPGLLIYLWLLIRFFVFSIRSVRSIDNTRGKFCALGILSSMAGIAVMSVTDPVVFCHPFAAMVGTIMGTATLIPRFLDDRTVPIVLRRMPLPLGAAAK